MADTRRWWLDWVVLLLLFAWIGSVALGLASTRRSIGLSYAFPATSQGQSWVGVDVFRYTIGCSGYFFPHWLQPTVAGGFHSYRDYIRAMVRSMLSDIAPAPFTRRLFMFRIPYWPLIGIFGALCVWRVIVVRRREEMKTGLCKSCGYDLRATPERCPECGRVVEKKAEGLAQL
jgi:hypothetical protein